MKTSLRLLLLVATPLALASCSPPLANTNSTGNITVTGDESWSAALKGVEFTRASGTNAPACTGRLFDLVAEFNVEAYAKYGFGLSVGPAGRLAAYVTGAQAQGTTPAPIVAGGYATYGNGSKGDRANSYATKGGTVTVTRFDAQRITGTFELDGTGPCRGTSSTTSCTTHASGDFDFTNQGCEPPLP